MKATSLTIGILLGLTTSVPALACPTEATGTLADAVNDWLASKDIPAGAMCVAAINGTSQWATCDGYQEPGVLASTETLFQIGSVTKSFTGTLLAKRVKQGWVDLNDRIDPYLPAAYDVGSSNPVTFRQLGKHTSGLPQDSFLTGNIFSNPSDGVLLDFFICVGGSASCFNPSQGYEYSNFGFSVLGATLAYIDGYDGDWPEDIDDAVLDPLQMYDTQVYERWAANAPVEFSNDAAHGYQWEDGCGWQSVGSAPHYRCPAHNPSGCLYASTHDMRLWLGYHMGLTTPSTVLGEARDLIRNQASNYVGTSLGWDFTYGATCQGSGNWNIVSKAGSVGTQKAVVAYLQNASSPNAVSPRGVVLLINREPYDDGFDLTDLAIELLQVLRP